MLSMHTLKLHECNHAFLLTLKVGIKFCDSFDHFISLSVYLALFFIQLLLLFWIGLFFVLKNNFLLVEILQMHQHMHPSKVV